MTSRPLVAELLARRGDRLDDAVVLERPAALEADVAQHLRQRLEAPADLADRPSSFLTIAITCIAATRPSPVVA